MQLLTYLSLPGSSQLIVSMFSFMHSLSSTMHIMSVKTTTVLLVMMVLLLFAVATGTISTANAPPMFIFGDSLLDVGNNNYIFSLSRANYPPNGIDFGYPSGRFTNGRTIVDIIDQEFGKTSFTPAYLAPTTVGPVILKGVNYASGAGGIFNESGKGFIERINMVAQVDNFANTRQDIISMIGEVEARKLFKTAIFMFAFGSNDFINNFFSSNNDPGPPDAFVASMVSRLRVQLTRLYSLGARKIVVPNVGPIGCIPYVRDKNLPTPDDSCVAFPNKVAQSYNSLMKTLLSELSSNLEGSYFLYGDVYSITLDLTQNPKSYGFESVKSACCYSSGLHGGLIPCFPGSKVCEHREKYVFWDAYHPSDAANVIVAKRLLYGNTRDISPLNIMQLVRRA